MADQIGVVVKKESDNYSLVAANRKSACGGCNSPSSGCPSCLESTKTYIRAANPMDAQPGDLVKVHLPPSSLYIGAVILYLFPVIGLMAGMFTGTFAHTLLGTNQTLAAIGGAVVGLMIGYSGALMVNRSPNMTQRLTPTITGIIQKGKGVKL